jgi:hypothetical protein
MLMWILIALQLGSTFTQATTSSWDNKISIVTKTGTEAAGQIQDIRSGVLYLNTASMGQSRVSLSDIVVIDFTGQSPPRTDASVTAGPGEHMLVWRDGRTMRGEFLGLLEARSAGTWSTAFEFAFRGADGEVLRFTGDEAAQLYLNSVPNGLAGAEGQTRQIVIPATHTWVSTGIVVHEGDYVTFSASGTIQLSTNRSDTASPAGSVQGRLALRAPRPRDLAGALLGRVGGSEPFGIGDQTAPLRMPASGELLLGINDDELRDNSGEFLVTIRTALPATIR